MTNKPIEPSPEVAKAFVRNLKAYFAGGRTPKAEAITDKQVWLLSEHTSRTVKVHEVKEMFVQMRDKI
jgi:hypothetical protein